MKKNTVFRAARRVAGVLVLLLIFGVTFTACGGGGKSGSSGSSSSSGSSNSDGQSSAPAKKEPKPEPTPRDKYDAKAPDPAKLKGDTLTIPEGMTVIPDNYIKTLPKGKEFVNIIIPEGVTKIGESAFKGPVLIGNGTIKTVVFPSTLKEIGKDAFWRQSIEELYLPDGVTKIGESAFIANKITKIRLPDGLKEIPYLCFNSNDLKAVVLPSSFSKMGEAAFTKNPQLNTVIWPDGPVEFWQRSEPRKETYAAEGNFFRECGFTEATFPKGLKVIPEGMYSHNNIKNLVIPEGVEVIGADAFFNNPIESITLPSTLKSLVIGSLAPKNLKNPPIKTITIGDGVLTDGEYYSGATAAAVVTAVLGPVGLLAAAWGTEGKTYLPGDFMAFYGPMFGRKAGTYEYKNGDWTAKK